MPENTERKGVRAEVTREAGRAIVRSVGEILRSAFFGGQTEEVTAGIEHVMATPHECGTSSDDKIPRRVVVLQDGDPELITQGLALGLCEFRYPQQMQRQWSDTQGGTEAAEAKVRTNPEAWRVFLDVRDDGRVQGEAPVTVSYPEGAKGIILDAAGRIAEGEPVEAVLASLRALNPKAADWLETEINKLTSAAGISGAQSLWPEIQPYVLVVVVALVLFMLIKAVR